MQLPMEVHCFLPIPNSCVGLIRLPRAVGSVAQLTDLDDPVGTINARPCTWNLGSANGEAEMRNFTLNMLSMTIRGENHLP